MLSSLLSWSIWSYYAINKTRGQWATSFTCGRYLRFHYHFTKLWSRKFFNILHLFLLFCFYLPLRVRCGPLFVKIWIPSTQGCFVPNLVEIGPVVLKRGFFNIFNIILLFRFYLPFEKDVAYHLNKFESPPSKGALCQIWLKLIKLIWIQIFSIYFFLFRYYIPLQKGVVFHF